MTYQEVADSPRPDDSSKTLFNSAQAALMAVKKAMVRAETDEEIKDSRDLDVARTERLQRALWTRALQGDEKAISQVIRLMEMRSKLLGTQQRPSAPEMKAPEGDVVDELARRRGERRAAASD